MLSNHTWNNLRLDNSLLIKKSPSGFRIFGQILAFQKKKSSNVQYCIRTFALTRIWTPSAALFWKKNQWMNFNTCFIATGGISQIPRKRQWRGSSFATDLRFTIRSETCKLCGCQIVKKWSLLSFSSRSYCAAAWLIQSQIVRTVSIDAPMENVMIAVGMCIANLEVPVVDAPFAEIIIANPNAILLLDGIVVM